MVKNAAGFDYPKLLCGSMGALGVLVETTFKVFPRPRRTCTLELSLPDLSCAVDKIREITLSKWEPDALELLPHTHQILLRLAGNPDALEARMPAILDNLQDCAPRQLPDDQADARWAELQAFRWADDSEWLLKVPTTPAHIEALDILARRLGVQHHYAMAGNLAWLAGSGEAVLAQLSSHMEENALAGMLFRGTLDKTAYGAHPRYAVHEALKQAMDPHGKFPDLP